MSQTTTPSGADVLAILDQAAGHAEERGHMISADNLKSASTAVAALIARNAELEAERKAQMSADDVLSAIEDSAICLENWGELHEARDLRRAAYTLIADRDALAAEKLAVREVTDEMVEAALKAFYGRQWKVIKNADEPPKWMHAALTSALARTPANGGDDE